MILLKFKILGIASLFLFDTLLAATLAEWGGRSIHQTLVSFGYGRYCGGTWQGIISKLDYIQSRISQLLCSGSLYSVNPNFGSAGDLKALAAALKSLGIYLMVDVAADHMASDDAAESIDYTVINPFNDKKYFHNICWVTDYSNQTNVELCWLGNDQYPLPDLNTTRTDVRNMFSSGIEYLVSTYSIGTVKHVDGSFWSIFNSASGVYNAGEVADGNVPYVCPYQNYMDGVLAYPTYYQATEFFSNTSATSLNFVNGVNAMNCQCKDITLLRSFSENHDQPRFAYYTSDLVLARYILVFTMLQDGIPIRKLSSSFLPHLLGMPLYKLTEQMNAIRSLAIAKCSDYLRWNTKSCIQMHIMLLLGRGRVVTVYDLTGLLRRPTWGFPAGLAVVDVLSCRNITVDASGGLAAEFVGGLPMVYYPYFLLPGTGWCGY
ncbi:glycoside hydrolase [Acephala macrosclerotiorum]|nr:glycoside hydrolase [Acephala macrosclerotiorum]